MNQDLILYHLLEQIFEDYLHFKKELQDHFKDHDQPDPASQLKSFYLSCVEKLQRAHLNYGRAFPTRRLEDIQESFDLLSAFIRATPEYRTFDKNKIDFSPHLTELILQEETIHLAAYQLTPRIVAHHRYWPQRWRSQGDYSKWLSALHVAALTVSLFLMMGFIGIYFILQLATDSLEQLIFHEGWQHAILTLLGTAMSSYIVSEIANCMLYKPLLQGAVYLGCSNPIGIATFGWLSAVLASGSFIAIFLERSLAAYGYPFIESQQLLSGQRQFLPLTTEEILKLKAKSLDIASVKCALMLGYLVQENRQRPSWLSRFFSPSNSPIQAQIEQDRALREGATRGSHTVFDFAFDLHLEHAHSLQSTF